jgi:hypothetical protein
VAGRGLVAATVGALTSWTSWTSLLELWNSDS